MAISDNTARDWVNIAIARFDADDFDGARAAAQIASVLDQVEASAVAETENNALAEMAEAVRMRSTPQIWQMDPGDCRMSDSGQHVMVGSPKTGLYACSLCGAGARRIQ